MPKGSRRPTALALALREARHRIGRTRSDDAGGGGIKDGAERDDATYTVCVRGSGLAGDDVGEVGKTTVFLSQSWDSTGENGTLNATQPLVIAKKNTYLL